MKKISRKEAVETANNIRINAERERLELAEKEAEIYNSMKGEMIWLVGQSYTDYHPQAWELIGIFSTKEKAIAACKDWRYFVVHLEIDAPAPDESTPFPNYFFPKGQGWPE